MALIKYFVSCGVIGSISRLFSSKNSSIMYHLTAKHKAIVLLLYKFQEVKLPGFYSTQTFPYFFHRIIANKPTNRLQITSIFKTKERNLVK